MPPARLIAALATAALVLFAATAAPAQPRHYALNAKATKVGFTADFGKDRITGSMPVTEAALTLDFQSLANCSVAVTLDASRATASFPFAAQAMRGPLVLDTKQYPQIRFVSTAVHAKGDGALIDGRITIRGATRPITLTAALFRQVNTQPGELDHLVIRLTGTVDRSAFGADGWKDMVGDAVTLDILASIDRIE